MYFFSDPLVRVKGVGSKLLAEFAAVEINTVLDLVLQLPNRYEDRSKRVTIAELAANELVTIQVVVASSNNSYRGRRSMQKARVKDASGTLNLLWFNNKFVIDRLKPGTEWLISGKTNDRGVMVQPTVEPVSLNTTHTDRLVPIYGALGSVKLGLLRRILKEVTDNLAPQQDAISHLVSQGNLTRALQQVHFPDNETAVLKARERLALEELLHLINHSQLLKEKWHRQSLAPAITLHTTPSLPFKLTTAQEKAVQQVYENITSTIPMNRLLIGDVGSGKTVVAALAALQLANNGLHTTLIAPTQILASQHANTLQQLFPQLPISLVTAQSKLHPQSLKTPTCFVGTHALVNKITSIKPGLIIYDEQHRFGVNQRSQAVNSPTTQTPHVLTMTATPIPRSLMLTIFSHLDLSLIDELPPGRKPVTTWLIPPKKRADSWLWLAEQLKEAKKHNQLSQALLVCPFINQSETTEFSAVSAAKVMAEEASHFFSTHHLKVGLLHGQMAVTDKKSVTEQLYAGNIDILVTTPVIEVGLDIAAASFIYIEGAERFGLASLHQLRGRVGRAGQQAFCVLIPTKTTQNPRLKEFTNEHNGLKLAELDLQRRGGGDLFGTTQSGFDQLRFASWTNTEIITQARTLYTSLTPQQHKEWLTQSPLNSFFSQDFTQIMAN